ncbi:hypothetical protein PENTCL1PPCAC_13043, partial [Pristionchus entomophagus]
ETSCFLRELPREVRWMILDFVPESIAEIKLVSRSARVMAEEWADSTNPVYNTVEANKQTDDGIHVVIGFFKSQAACFPQLRDFFQDPNTTSSKE